MRAPPGSGNRDQILERRLFPETADPSPQHIVVRRMQVRIIGFA
jgi:hypothetical protein